MKGTGKRLLQVVLFLPWLICAILPMVLVAFVLSVTVDLVIWVITGRYRGPDYYLNDYLISCFGLYRYQIV